MENDVSHTAKRVPVAPGAGYIRCSCGWRSEVEDDKYMYDEGRYVAQAAHEAHKADALGPSLGQSPEVARPHKIQLQLSEKELRAISEIAVKEGKTQQDVARDLILDFLKSQ